MDKDVYTSNPDRLVRVVELLSRNSSQMDDYTDHSVFRPYNINIRRCVPELRVEDAKRLLDFSFTTRQGGQPKKALSEYKEAEQEACKALSTVLGILNGTEDARAKYNGTLLIVHGIPGVQGIGQKIATMFLKFLILYSDDFPGRDELLGELLIPFDGHVMRLLFTKVNKKKTSRLDLYPEDIDQAGLRYVFNMEGSRVEIVQGKKRTREGLYALQEHIREDFRSLNIKEPPIILDHLWYVGAFHCSHAGLGAIGCNSCFLAQECETGRLSHRP